MAPKTPAAADAVPVDQSPPPDVSAAPTPEPELCLWEYQGPPGRTYPHIPITVDPGDVVYHLGGPPAADGAWAPAPAGAVAKPADNARPDPAPPVLTGDLVCGVYPEGGVIGG